MAIDYHILWYIFSTWMLQEGASDRPVLVKSEHQVQSKTGNKEPQGVCRNLSLSEGEGGLEFRI